MSDLLAIGSSGVLAYQYALTSTSNNIANAAVDGYSRQEAQLVSVMPRLMGVDYIGSGIYTTGVRRQYDAFVESNLQRSISELRGQEPLVTYANRAFDLLSSEQIGLTRGFDAFFAAVRGLGAEPGSLIARSALLREADGVAAGFRQMRGQWDLLSEETEVGMQAAAREINILSEQLATINKQLARKSTEISQPPELLDQRDNLLRTLAGVARIRTAVAPNGEVKVSLNGSLDAATGGAVIVDKDRATTLSIVTEPDGGRSAALLDPFSVEARVVSGLSGGTLGGLLAFREQVLLPGRTRLDDLARIFASEVNTLHRQGIDARGNMGQDLFRIDAPAGAAATLALAFTDPQQVAAAGPLRVVADGRNVTGTEATVAFSPPQFQQPLALTTLFDPLAGQPSGEVVVQFGAFESIASVPTGLRDVAIFFDTEAGQWPQLLTRDGRHLLGSPLSELQRDQLMGYGGFMPGATYSDAYLNATDPDQAYLHADYFIGARAAPIASPLYDTTGTDPHQLLGVQKTAARLQGQSIAAPGVVAIESGALVLNGEALSGFTGLATAEALAEWLNGQSARTGVTSSVVYPLTATQVGSPESSTAAPSLLLTSIDPAREIRLGFGPGGTPSDMEALGLRTGLYWQGEVPEDLVVMATSTAAGVTELRVSAEYSGREGDPLQTLRARRFEIAFDTAERYRITDMATGTVVADRAYDPERGTIDYRGLTIALREAPSAGDRYRVDGNQDGNGDNANLVELAAFEFRKLEGGYALGEAYVDLSSRVGTVAWQAGLARSALEVVNAQAVQARDAASGVSLDAEAANLIRFQQAYQANAKVMQVASDLFDTLIRIN